MAVQARVSSSELRSQVEALYSNQNFEVALVNSSGSSYTPGLTTDSSFMANEVTQGLGGYDRQIISFSDSDIASYADGGIGLATKAATFSHDGSASTYIFNNVVLLRSSGDVTALGGTITAPSSGVNGTYSNIPTTTISSGRQLRVNIVVSNGGIAVSDYAIAIATPGYGYAVADAITISNTVLAAAGVTTSGTGDLSFVVDAVGAGTGGIVAVAPTTTSTVMSDGNEAVFYYNLKQFGVSS